MDLKRRLLIAEMIEWPIIAAILFGAADTILWTAGWIFLILFAGSSIALTFWLLEHSPGVIEERMSMFKPNQKAWDKIFVVIIVILFITWLVLMPLDAVRFHWSYIPMWLSFVGFIVVLLSFYLFFVTFQVNPYLSATVRIQQERGQTVISTGPYHYVRHPMYAAATLFFVGSAFLLGSWYGVILGLIFGGVLAIRAVFEERVLREELEGYDTYMTEVKYRLIPYVW